MNYRWIRMPILGALTSVMMLTGAGVAQAQPEPVRVARAHVHRAVRHVHYVVRRIVVPRRHYYHRHHYRVYYSYRDHRYHRYYYR
jgi:hypothetical protein